MGEEYNSLREALLRTLDEAGMVLNHDSARALHAAVDQAQRAGVERFIQLREERLATRQSEFLDALGGRAQVQSEPGKGTRISLVLPRTSDSARAGSSSLQA